MCTGIRFTSTDGAMYLGRNLDWSTPFGEHIVITPKGYPLAKAFPEGVNNQACGACNYRHGNNRSRISALF